MTHLFVHYHLRGGGVTQVLRQQCLSCAELGWRHGVLSSQPADCCERHATIAALDYAAHCAHELHLDDCLDAIKDWPAPRIWHIHNPALGCHPRMTALLTGLLQCGERVIQHHHDFAEDQRPQNLLRLQQQGLPWFPFCERSHSIVLTQRDRNILCRAGLPESQCSVLINPLSASPLAASMHASPYVLAPTRAITRKNIGELLLLAMLAAPDVRFAISQSPGNSQHQEEYAHWQKLAQQWQLPIDWAVTESSEHALDFDALRKKCTHLLSTSRQEGLGMIFLEAIAWQRPLLGRRIAHIDADLRAHGIEHPLLYDEILIGDVPFGPASFEEKTRLLQAFQQDSAIVQIVSKGQSHAAKDWLAQALSMHQTPLPIDTITPFHPHQHAQKIADIAKQLLQVPKGELRYLDPEKVARGFDA